MITRIEQVISPPLKLWATIDGKKTIVLVTHFINDNGHYKNRVQTKDGEEHIILNSDLDFVRKVK